MEIFAEFSHVVMFAKILFRNYCCRLVAILWLSRQFSQCVLFLALFLFFSVWLSTSAKRIVSKQKVFLVRTVFVCVCSSLNVFVLGFFPIRLLTVSPDIVSFRIVHACLFHCCHSLDVCFLYLSYGFPHNYWLPLSLNPGSFTNCTQSTQKVFWFDGSNLYFSGFAGITTANQPSAKCKMMAMGKRLQFRATTAAATAAPATNAFVFIQFVGLL